MSVKILVIDDDAGMRESLSDLLSLEQFECTSAENGKMGLAMTSVDKPNLVVLDIQLPDMTGYQVVQVLKKDPALKNIPVIMVSGRFTEHQDRVQGLELGADEYFPKPFDPTLLVARIKNLLRSAHPLHLN